MDNILIIGAGIAGLTAAETIRRKNKVANISIITEEAYYPYSRIKLSKYVNSEVNYDDLYIHKESWYKENNINIISERRVEGIEPNKKEITLDNKDVYEYSKLILATGGYNFIPPFPNVGLQGIFSIRSIKDVLNIQEYIKTEGVKNVVVIGGGLLGLEAAWAIKSSGTYNLSVIETAPRLLPRQLDQEGSLILEALISKKDIGIYKGEGIKEIVGKGKASGVVLNNGEVINAELIIISTGIRSQLSPGRETGITANRGIIVNEFMETNIPNIYAAGDCAEYNGMVYGIWPVATEQGKIAGLNAIGEREAYKEIVPSNLLQVVGINVFSTGDINEENQMVKYENGLYTKFFIKDNKICGAILIGETKKGFSIKRAIEEKRDFSSEISQNINLLSII